MASTQAKQHPTTGNSQQRRQNVSCYKSRRDVRAGGRSCGLSFVGQQQQQNKFRVEMRVACSVRNTAEHEHGSLMLKLKLKLMLMLLLMLLSQMLGLKIVGGGDRGATGAAAV